MNANELANELKNHRESLRYETTESVAVATSFYEECETTLRQLQAEIERLNNLSTAISNDCNNTALERNRAYAEIEALKKHEVKHE